MNDIHPFEAAVSVVGTIVGGIIVLTLFFTLFGYIGRRSSRRTTRMVFKGVFDENTRVTVHVTSGATFENVRMLGFVDTAAGKGAFPHELHGMVVLEHADGRRTMIQPKTIRMIDVPPGDG